jgi:flagellar biosynthesis protein FlgN
MSISSPSTHRKSSPVPAAITKKIRSLIQADIASAQQLLVALKSEREALQQRDYLRVTDIIASKTNILDLLESHSIQRQQLIKEAGLRCQGNTMEEQWADLIKIIADPALQADWEHLLQALRDCRHANSVNGKMIARGQQSLGRLLNILRGQIDTPELYNQKGAATGHAASRTVVKV